MILIKGLVLCFYLFQMSGRSSQVWPEGIAVSHIAKSSRFVEQLSGLANSSVASSEVRLSSNKPESTLSPGEREVESARRRSSPEVRSAKEAIANREFNDYLQTIKLASQETYPLAKLRLEESLMRHPRDPYAVPLMDLELAHDDYASVYKVSAALIKRGDRSFSVLIRGSLAAAELGEVYSGQREFLVNVIQAGDSKNPFTNALILKGDTPEIICALSNIALGSEYDLRQDTGPAIRCYEAALAVDPGNTTLCRRLSSLYSTNGSYSLAVKVLESGLLRIGNSGFLRDDFLDSIRRHKTALKLYGDGHPMPVPKVPVVSTIKP